MQVPAVPTTEAAPEPEPMVKAEPQPEPEPAPEAAPEPVLTAVHVVPDAPSTEAPNLTLQRVEALQRLRATLAADRAAPDPAPSPALNAGLLRRIEHLQHVGRP
jgi:outer membrane biosynthesis protein TonB